MLSKNMHNESHSTDTHQCHICMQPFKVGMTENRRTPQMSTQLQYTLQTVGLYDAVLINSLSFLHSFFLY